MLGKLARDYRRRSVALSTGDWLGYFQWGGVAYTTTSLQLERDTPPTTYPGFAQALLYTNPAVFTCCNVRQLIFSEARFKWRQLRKGQVGDLFGTPALQVLEQPAPGKTTSDLLSVALTYADLGGNWYGLRTSGGVVPLRPDWMEIVFASNGAAASPWDPTAQVLGYRYTPGGPGSGEDPVVYAASQVAHFMPQPDPLAPWRGMSWLTPLIREVMGDNAAARFKLRFFEEGGTPNLLVKPPPDMGKAEATEWKELFEAEYGKGIESAYRNLFVGGGADVEVVGRDFQQMDFRALQGLSETRIASASGVGAVLAQFSEGLQGSALNAGNYQSARRRVADATMRPLWTKMVGALSHIVPPPESAELWYDDRHIPFLQEDAADDAKIQQLQAVSMRQLVDAGFDPAAVVEAITSGDLRRLHAAHSGLFSVQLQKPGTPAALPAGQGQQPPQQPQQGQQPRGMPALEAPAVEIALEEDFAAFLD